MTERQKSINTLVYACLRYALTLRVSDREEIILRCTESLIDIGVTKDELRAALDTLEALPSA
jgi:hypothetical protein